MNKSKPVRVLQVLTTMNLGGAETMIMNYYRALDRTLVQFDFLLHRNDKGFYEDEIERLGGRIYKLPKISPKTYFTYIKKLGQFFEEHPEYKIVHSHLNALSGIVLKVAKEKNIKIRIAHSHLAIEKGVLKKVFTKNTDVKATIKDYIQTLIKGRVKNVSTHYFACGEKAGIWLFGKENAHKVTIIHNAIEASKFAYNPIKAKEIKEELNITHKNVFGHVGRFNEQKNHYFLVQIFSEICRIDNNCILVLIGEGNLKPLINKELKRLNIEKQVLFLGLRKDIPDLLQGFDLFLFPSLYEGLPVTLIEAQASGLRVVASSTIADEVDLTGLTTFVDLNQPKSHWANISLSLLNYKRKNTLSEIKLSGYDIHENSKKLQDFYLEKQICAE